MKARHMSVPFKDLSSCLVAFPNIRASQALFNRQRWSASMFHAFTLKVAGDEYAIDESAYPLFYRSDFSQKVLQSTIRQSCELQEVLIPGFYPPLHIHLLTRVRPWNSNNDACLLVY